MSDHRSRDEVIVSEHLSELRGKVRMLTWISGLSWTILILFGGLLVTGFFDWMIHFDDPGLRLVIAVALLVAVSVIAWRQLIQPLIQPLTTTFLALRIERRFPGLHSRVLSAVEFLQHQLDARVGSPELQQAVVRDALRDLEKIEPNDIVETRGVKRITVAGAVLCGMIATVVFLHPVEAATSVKRLMFPFADCPWPRQFELKLVRPDLTPVVQAPDQPLFIARGDTLELYVIGSRGRLPSRVWFEHRLDDDPKVQKEPLRQTTLRDEKGRSYEAAVISWVATRGPLQFRATGGDDETMSFVRVEVVQPPTLENLRVTVVPPAYSGRPAETLPQGVGHVQGLLGTSVKIEASADKRLKSARLRVADKPAKNLEIGEDQQQFTASFTITDPGVTGYWFELIDEAGFTDPEAPRYELRGIADTIPDVVIEQPMADVMLAPDAELPIKILAKDDLGLKSVRISYTLNDDPTEKLIPLVSVAEQSEPLVLSTPDYVWKLADLSLEPGNRITFRAEATDNYDLGPVPHVGKSAPRTISIVSKDEKQKELAGRVGDLLEDLQQATSLQERARQQTTELQTQLNTAGELRSQDLDQLHRIELDQRQAASRLNRPADGVQSQAQQLQEEFRANKLDDPETELRLNRIIEELSRLGREQFPEIESALTRAAKQAEDQTRSGSPSEGDDSKPESGTKSEPGTKTRPDKKPESTNSPAANSSTDPVTPEPKTPPASKPEPAKTGPGKPDVAKPGPDGEKTKPEPGTDPANEKTSPKSPAGSQLDSALTEAQTRQSQALEKLQELQGLLSEWRDQRDVSRELNSLIAEQEGIQKDSTELGAQTLSKSAAELSPQQKADLTKMAARQLKNAERVEQFRKQLQQAAEALQQRDPDAADRFKEAQEELNNDGTSGKLREAAQGITDNQIGEAAQMQKQALDDLRDLDKQLKREPTDDVETLVKQIDQVQQEFETLRKDQEELKKQTQKIAGQPNSPEKTEQLQQLQQKQQELSEKIDQAERRLEKLRLRSPTEAAERAQERLDRIQEQLQDPNQIDDAGEQMQQVLDDLEQVQRDLALEKRVAMERLAVEELEKIQDQLQALLNQQQGVITETERLSVELAQRGSLTRAQLKTLRDLAEVERGLQADAEQMEKSLKVAEVFSLVLRRLSRSLKMSADRLSEKKVDAAALSLQRDAVKKIESLLAVLKPEERKPQTDGGQSSPPPGQGQNPEDQPKPEQGQPPGESLPQLAQLKLLKALQEEFLERTQLLDSLKDKDGKFPESAAAELEELAHEQSELADLTRDVIAKMLQSEPDREDAKDKKPHGETSKDKPVVDPAGNGEKPMEPEAKPKPRKKKSDLDSLDLDNFEPGKRPEKNSTGKQPGAKED